MTRAKGSARKPLPNSPFNRPDTAIAPQEYADGDRVTHDKHGLGRVVRVDDGACVVEFAEETYRRIVVSDPRLIKL